MDQKLFAYDLRQSESFSKYMRMVGWKVEKLDDSYVYIKRLPIIGSFVKIQRAKKNYSSEELLGLRKKHKAYEISIEPYNSKQSNYYKSIGYKQNKFSSLTSKTLLLDLSKSKESLLKKMHHKTRYNIKVAYKKGVLVKQSKDIEKFVKFWQKCAKERGQFLPHKNEITSMFNAFGKNSFIEVATMDGEWVSALLTIVSLPKAYYMYAASSSLGKKLFAPTLVTWNSILSSKKLKAKIYDFEGIYDERFPLSSWKGFTRFKKGFGGEEFEFPGTLSKSYLPFGITF